jgi:hypothetical protein
MDCNNDRLLAREMIRTQNLECLCIILNYISMKQTKIYFVVHSFVTYLWFV